MWGRPWLVAMDLTAVLVSASLSPPAAPGQARNQHPALSWLGALGTSAATTALVPSPDEKLLAAADRREVKLWNIDRQTVERAIPIELGTSYSNPPIAFSRDGRLLVVTGAAIRLYDAATGALRATLPLAGAGGTTSVVFLPGGKRLAAEGVDGVV